MSAEQELLSNWRSLPPDKQEEVLDFVEFLRLKTSANKTSLGEGLRQIRSKIYGTKVELVDRWYPSSKMCSQCHHVQPMTLSQRIFCCQSCGHIQDRDENASLNLENAPNDIVRSA